MKSYVVKHVGLNRRHNEGECHVIATDVRHAINQTLELIPNVRVIAAFPEPEWNDNDN